MRDFHLRFCVDTKGWNTSELIIDLLEWDENVLPETGGAYVLGTSDTMLTYPWGTSPIFYIGRAGNLRARVAQHRKGIDSARKNHDEYWWPRYQYGAAFGAHVAWYSRHGQEDPKNIEAILIECFYEAYGAIPVANSYWPQQG